MVDSLESCLGCVLENGQNILSMFVIRMGCYTPIQIPWDVVLVKKNNNNKKKTTHTQMHTHLSCNLKLIKMLILISVIIVSSLYNVCVYTSFSSFYQGLFYFPSLKPSFFLYSETKAKEEEKRVPKKFRSRRRRAHNGSS